MFPRAAITAALLSAPALALSPTATLTRFDPGPEPILPNLNQTPAGRLKNGILRIHLELRSGRFHPQADDGPWVEAQAFAEAGRPPQVPGPLIRVAEGTVIEATITNPLSDSTLVLHGLRSRPGKADDTVQVAPGASRMVRFAAGKPGTYFYWGTTTGKKMDDDRWIDSQLYGGLIVDRADTPAPAGERVFIIGLWNKPADSAAREPARELMVINGKSWPQTERLTYTVGDTVHWRWINASPSSHPMHLHGFYYQVESRGSWIADTIYRPADQRLVVTELMAPGGTMMARWTPARPGNWAFHCHFAFHISTELFLAPSPPLPNAGKSHEAPVHGMAGLVLGIHVNPRPGTRPAPVAAGDPRRLRLLVQPAPAGADSAHLMGYVLQEGGTEPAADSVVIPGPTIVLERGRPVRITVVNHLAEPTAVHWHGIELESYPDGVPGWSGTPGRIFHPMAAGDSFVAEFTPPRTGTFIYHSHSNELTQIFGGLYGALIVVDSGKALDTAATRLVVVGAMFRGDTGFGLVNGRADPAPIELTQGRRYRFRLINIGDARTYYSVRRSDSSRVFWTAVAKDGADLPPAQAVPQKAPLLTGPGETADFELTASLGDDLTLDIDSPFSGWRLAVPVRVRRPEAAP